MRIKGKKTVFSRYLIFLCKNFVTIAKSICFQARRNRWYTGDTSPQLFEIICHFQKYKIKVCRTNGSKDTANCLFWAKCQLGKDDLHQNTTLHLLWQVRVRVRAILLFVAEKNYRCLHNFLRRSAGPETKIKLHRLTKSKYL